MRVIAHTHKGPFHCNTCGLVWNSHAVSSPRRVSNQRSVLIRPLFFFHNSRFYYYYYYAGWSPPPSHLIFQSIDSSSWNLQQTIKRSHTNFSLSLYPHCVFAFLCVYNFPPKTRSSLFSIYRREIYIGYKSGSALLTSYLNKLKWFEERRPRHHTL
jgi:hypothetical protein